MSEWKNFSLGDVVTFRNGKKRPLATGYIPVYGGNGILSYTNQFNFNNCVVIGRVGAYCGNVFLAKEYCWVSDNAIATLPKKSVNTHFLFYLLKSLKLNNHSIGSGQPLLTQGILNELKINLPPLETQKKIAAVLSALDDKIELNDAINKNLEEQTQAIFKSWFIEDEKFIDMDLKLLSDLCEVITKGTTPTTLGKHFLSDGINFIKAESIQKNHSIDLTKISYIDEETHNILKRSIIKEEDILFTIAGTLGRFAFVDKSILPANTNQAVAIIRADERKVSPKYVYSFFMSDWHVNHYQRRIQQSVQANLSLSTIKSLCIPMLPDEQMKSYVELIEPIISMISSTQLENKKLGEIRDALLPRLMSGEIDVSAVEI